MKFPKKIFPGYLPFSNPNGYLLEGYSRPSGDRMKFPKKKFPGYLPLSDPNGDLMEGYSRHNELRKKKNRATRLSGTWVQ